MPTGYTAPVADGKVTTLEGYMLGVSRGMAFAYHLRDSSFDGTIPLQKVEPFYLDNYNEAVEALNHWNSLGADGRMKEWRKYARDIHRSNKSATIDYDQTKQRYEAMIEKIEAWEAPEILQSTKKYALEQLQQSIEFDCGRGPYLHEVSPFEEWVGWNEDRLVSDVTYALKSWTKAKKRVDECNEYIKALYESLGLESP